MKREIETVRNIIVVAIVAALLAFVVWTLAAADGRTSPPELPTSTPPMVEGTPDTSTPVAPYPGPVDPYPPPPGADPYPAPYPAPVYLPFSIGGNGEPYP